MSDIDQTRSGPTGDEKDAQADGRADSQQIEPAPEVTDVEVPGATPPAADASGGEAPPVAEANGDVVANAERLNAGSEIAEGVTDEDAGADETVDESDEDEDTGGDEVDVVEEAATLLGKFQDLAEGTISREEARQWLEENYPEKD